MIKPASTQYNPRQSQVCEVAHRLRHRIMPIGGIHMLAGEQMTEE